MKRTLAFLSLSLAATILEAASLQVYQDRAIYEYQPKDHYLGITDDVTATCKGEPLSLQPKVSCDSSDGRLCQEFIALQKANDKLASLTNNINLLDQILSLHQPQTLDAQKTIEAAREIGTEKAKLEAQQKRDKIALDLQKQAFIKQTSANLPLYYTQTCDDAPTKLELKNGLIYFKTFYEADLDNKDAVKVTQYLAVTNRSGIDIVAGDTTFYYRMANRTIRPVHFYPWIVSEYQPPIPSPAPMLAKSEMIGGDIAPVEPAVEAPAPMAEYIDAREYKVKNLLLPSTGEPVNVKVTSWNSAMECGLHVSPYVSSTVYEKCRFTPQTQIENNSWKLTKGSEVINNHAFGEYKDKMYNLYTKADEDIKVVRKPIVRQERDTGFFGNTIRKKDGYTLILTNKSDKQKTLTVTERIPTSTTENIKVKLLSVKSDKEIDYKVLKDGQIEMMIGLSPQESKKIEVLFEISYDKDLKVHY